MTKEKALLLSINPIQEWTNERVYSFIERIYTEGEELNSKCCENCKHESENYCWEHDCDCRHMGAICGKWENK